MCKKLKGREYGNRNTLEFLGTWELIYNPDFKVVEFDHFKSEAGLHAFVLSTTEWLNKTNAIGLYVKRGKYGGTYVSAPFLAKTAYSTLEI